MFISDQLIYIQMQKTGCTHIASVLSELFDGEMVGKHNAASDEQIESGRYFISSIRNPWSWYLSLWTYGVDGNGSIMHKLTKRRIRASLKNMIRNPSNGYDEFIFEATKDVKTWRNVYDRNDNVDSFRKWLRLIHDPANSGRFGEGYGETTVKNFSGLMTYRYLSLCCKHTQELRINDSVKSQQDLLEFDRENCYVDFFIKQIRFVIAFIIS